VKRHEKEILRSEFLKTNFLEFFGKTFFLENISEKKICQEFFRKIAKEKN